MRIAKIILTTVTSVIILSGCANGSFNTNAALSVGAGAL